MQIAVSVKFAETLDLNDMASEAFHRTGSKRAGVEEDMVKPTNPLQSDFTETSSMDSDEQYLVRARPSAGP